MCLLSRIVTTILFKWKWHGSWPMSFCIFIFSEFLLRSLAAILWIKYSQLYNFKIVHSIVNDGRTEVCPCVCVHHSNVRIRLDYWNGCQAFAKYAYPLKMLMYIAPAVSKDAQSYIKQWCNYIGYCHHSMLSRCLIHSIRNPSRLLPRKTWEIMKLTMLCRWLLLRQWFENIVKRQKFCGIWYDTGLVRAKF